METPSIDRHLKIFFMTLLVAKLINACGQKETEIKSDLPNIDKSRLDAQSDIRNGDIHLITYGLVLPFPNRDSLTKAYGFYYQDMGCFVSDTESKLIDFYNKQIIEHLSIQNGKDWFKRFSEIESRLQERYLKTNRK